MTNDSISVVIPAFNAEKTIGKCLQALKQQTFPPLEIIVVDDGSTDSTVRVAQEFATVIRNTHSKGAGGARNAGAFAAKGEIIAFTDSDCVPPSDWLEKIAMAFSDGSAGAVGGGYCCGADESFWQRFCCEELKFRRRNRKDEVTTLVANNFACRKSIFLEKNGFPEQYPVCEDMLLSYEISRESRVKWLKDNGVQHHFKNSLKSYLGHQYFFGAESTRFFFFQPELLKADNHQGKALPLAIGAAFFTAVLALLDLILIIFGNFALTRMLSIILGLFLLIHFILYMKFVCYLKKIRFPGVARAYGISFLRDVICGMSVFDGLSRAVRTK